MVRNHRRFTAQSADRTHQRAGADACAASWRTLASAAVASTLLVAVAIAMLSVVEAVFFKPAAMLAQRFPSVSEAQNLRASARLPTQISNRCARHELAPCLAD